MADQKSPLNGSKFPALSPEYKKIKKADGAGTKANLENSGKMLNSLDYEVTEEGVKIGIFGAEAPIADGHNNLSGDSQLPERRFLPDKGEMYKGSIAKGIESIIAESVADNTKIPRKDLAQVESKSELYDLLKDSFGDISKAEIKTAVLLSDEWHDALDELDLLQWL